MSAPAPEAPLLIDAGRVALLLGVSTRTVWRMVERGQFPQPVRLNRKFARWKRSDVLAWVEADRGTILAATAEAPVNRDLAPNSEFYLTYRYARVLETWGGGEDGGDRYREADRARLERWVAPTPP